MHAVSDKNPLKENINIKTEKGFSEQFEGRLSFEYFYFFYFSRHLPKYLPKKNHTKISFSKINALLIAILIIITCKN